MDAGFMTSNPYEGFVPNDFSEENYSKLDLHKNFVDKIILVSPSGKPMNREADLIDVWFDSGAMPYAQWHFPFESQNSNSERVYDDLPNDDTLKKVLGDNAGQGDRTSLAGVIPADFIAEGVDQTRGWFYTLHAISSLVFDEIAYKNVVSNGLVLDKNGQKMSKRLGNAADPFETIATYGPDATRWYIISNAQPWENLKFDTEGIDEVRRKFFGTLYNTYSFFALYANVDGFTNSEAYIPVEERPELDRWILSELHSLIKVTDEFLADYEPTRATRAIQDFVGDNLSNWYVRLNRRRFWKGEYSRDKIAAYQTLYEVLRTVAQLASPFAPFFMDRLYRDLTSVTGKSDSVHLSKFPEFNAEMVDNELQETTHLAQRLTSMIFSLRKQADLKVRQPLQKVMIPQRDENFNERLNRISELLKNEVNVKEVLLMSKDEAAHLLVKEIKPNFKNLGPKFGKDMKTVAAQIAQMDNDAINRLEEEGKFELIINGVTYTLQPEDFEIITKDIQGWVVAVDGNLTVALDTTLNEKLKNEGIARELVNRIQNLRKTSGLDVTDRIRVKFRSHPDLEKAVGQNSDYITSETLTDEIMFLEELYSENVVEIDEIVTNITVNKI